MQHCLKRLMMLCAAVICGLAVMSGSITAQAKEGGDAPARARILVTYFSATGNTKAAAEYIREATGGDIAEIIPAEPYTEADLDYRNPDSRVSKEHADSSIRPALRNNIDTDGYDVIFVGYPIWWGEAPNIVKGFVAQAQLAGKTLIPFCTSHSSGIGESDVRLQDLAEGAKRLPGKRFGMQPDKEEVTAWAASLEY